MKARHNEYIHKLGTEVFYEVPKVVDDNFDSWKDEFQGKKWVQLGENSANGDIYGYCIKAENMKELT